MSEQKFVFHVLDINSERLDKFLVASLPSYSRSRLQGLIQDGFVWINGINARKSGQGISSGDEIIVIVPPTPPQTLVPEDIPLDVIFENQDVLVLNKQAGIVVHPAAGHSSGTLVHAVLAHAPDLEGVGGEMRPGVVHRLDRDTSGVILFAKNDRSHRWLQEQFRSRQAKKVYLALVDGIPPTPQGRIDAPIGRATEQRKLMAVVPAQKGREAVTEYFTREQFPANTYIEAHPITGRTHQIRLHLKFLGCPVVGDEVYGKKKTTLPLTRHFLHAARLSISLPGELQPRQFDAGLPLDLELVLELLRNSPA